MYKQPSLNTILAAAFVADLDEKRIIKSRIWRTDNFSDSLKMNLEKYIPSTETEVS